MRAVLYVDRTNLYYYGGNINTPLSIAPPQTVYSDMDVIDTEQLAFLMDNFVKTNKLQKCSVVIFFSSQSCFQKEFPKSMNPEEAEIQKNHFIDNVPFNKVLSMMYPQKKDVDTVVAVNRDLAYTLKDIMIKMRFTVEAIVPSFTLFGDQQTVFNINTAQEIVKHFSSLIKMSFPLEEQEKAISKEEQEEFKFQEEQPESKTRLFVIICAFAVLILILVYIVFSFRKTPKKNTQNTITPTAKLAQTIKPTNNPIPSPTEIHIPKQEIHIRILNGSGIPGQADVIRERLEAAGYTSIELGNAPTQESNTVSIVVKPETQLLHRQEIDLIIRSLGHATTIRESNEIDVDVLISTRKGSSQ